MSQDKELSESLKQWMIDRWGVPLYSDYAWFAVNGKRYPHVVLCYGTKGGDREARMRVAGALKAVLESLPARGLLVLRDGPWVDFDEDWEHDGRFFQSKGQVSRAYVRLSFIDGPTEDELKALPAYKAEGQMMEVLA